MKLVTSEQMRALDRRTIELGTPSLELMERAGTGIAARIQALYPTACRDGVLIAAGRGNNGGDGFVIARWLKARGYRATVVLLAPRERVAGDARTNLDRWLKARGKLIDASGDDGPARLARELDAAGVVVDAILGTGLRSPVRGELAAAIEAINQSSARLRGRRPVVAVDLPSGLDGDTGEPLGVAIRADATITLGAIKLGLVLPVAHEWVGTLELIEIGLDERAFAEQAPLAEAGNRELLAPLVPARLPTSHKGTNGHLLIFGGSAGKSGAAALAGRGALRGGAGLVTIACSASVQQIIAAGLPEVMTESLGATSPAAWKKRLARKSALVIGPGLGTAPAVRRAVHWLVTHAGVPTVVDADGLNALSGDLRLLARSRCDHVLTPHPGEMARLMKLSNDEVQRDRRGVVLEAARRSGSVVVLKGSASLVAAPDGRLTVNTNGGPLLGTGGTGDVLAGLIGSLLAQGLAPYDAARLGVYLHGSAADHLATRLGDAGLLASELADELPIARRRLREGGSSAPTAVRDARRAVRGASTRARSG